tara:strand:- start:3279 stop:3743 length:465 start_codon:yes stop_codon:yes gene_type:complete
MEIITTYGDTVYNDGTIKKQMVYQFTDTNTMVSMWSERDTSTDIEWTMSLNKLTITCVDYVVFGTDVGVVQIDEVSSTGNKMIDRAWIRGRINKLLKLQKQLPLIKDEDMKLVVSFQLHKMTETLFDNDDTFDRNRTAAILCIRDLDLSGDEEE